REWRLPRANCRLDPLWTEVLRCAPELLRDRPERRLRAAHRLCLQAAAARVHPRRWSRSRLHLFPRGHALPQLLRAHRDGRAQRIPFDLPALDRGAREREMCPAGRHRFAASLTVVYAPIGMAARALTLRPKLVSLFRWGTVPGSPEEVRAFLQHR